MKCFIANFTREITHGFLERFLNFIKGYGHFCSRKISIKVLLDSFSYVEENTFFAITSGTVTSYLS